MSATDWKRLPLPSPVLIEARGADAVRYLNGQLTQDVRQLVSCEKALPACVTDAKGRLQFRVHLHSTADGGIRVSCEHEGADELFARLDRYLISDDATLEDISGAWTKVHVTGSEPPPLPEGAYSVSVNRIGIEGWDVWLPASRQEPLDHLPAWNSDEAQTLRIRAGIPQWGKELTAGLLPPEAGLDRTDISYAKGCYIGQEVISRIKSAGKVNRRLMRMTVDDSVPCQSGDLLVEADGKNAGQITSVANQSLDGRRALLGYLKRSSEDQAVFLESSASIELLGKA